MSATDVAGGDLVMEAAPERRTHQQLSRDASEPAGPPSPPISVRGLTKAYGVNRAVEDLSFEVGWGQVTGFLGPNGAGKSTTLRVLLGLVHPTAGEARILGRRYHELATPAVHVGALLETQQFHPGRTARAHLRVLTAAAGLPPQRADAVLASVGLASDAGRRVGEYSLGMRQRLGLAAALLGEPKVLVLDEPANGLDPSGIRWLRHLLRSFADDGGAVLVSSHQLGEVAQLADDVVVLNRGRLVVHTTIEDLTGGSSLEEVFFDLVGGTHPYGTSPYGTSPYGTSPYGTDSQEESR